MQSANGIKERGKTASKSVVKNNHLIQCYIYDNATVFKGDTFVYRGLFNRFGGYYDKTYFGYVVSLENYEKVKEEIARMVFGFIIHIKKNEEIVVKSSAKASAVCQLNEEADAEAINNTLKYNDLN